MHLGKINYVEEIIMKKNCWEYKKCGREVGGAKVKDLGVCPAATNSKFGY